MTRRERLEARLEKRRAWKASREAKSARAFNASSKATEGIPLGQPILVGHHSERRHRAALDKSWNKLGEACAHDAMAKHHGSKAGGISDALDRSIFSDDEDAIEALEAKARGCDESAELMKRANAAWKKSKGAPDFYALIAPPPSQEDLKLLTYALRGHVAMFGADRVGTDGRLLVLKYPPFSTSHPRAEARRCRQRIEIVKRRNARTAEAEAAPGGLLVTGTGDYVSLVFASKPERSILEALKAAGFRWSGGSWSGLRASIPDCVADIAP